MDQVALAGLYDRPADIERLAGLGVSGVRFPILWERHSALGERAWEWVDDGLDRLRRHGITPIVGLVHHGSGPAGVTFESEEFPERLAAFAHETAARYPWVRYFTPINEPLTTARFATLYGIWYPHKASVQSFARAVMIQMRAISAAMTAIRSVTPSAFLVQTEDLGKTYATRELQYQADFENERRWATFDLLCGRVVGGHPMAAYLRWAGVSDRELDGLASTACAPDIIGLNHYLTSERFLDHRLDRYPAASHGGNDHDRYADVEAVRVVANGVAGPYTLLRETWDRYTLPLAVTEAHLACTREQQLRWMREVWSAAVRLAAEGGDVRAVTAWSAFGAYDWASLLTRADRRYEPGLFDLRAPHARRTAVAQMVRALATSGTFDHPVVHAPGWWRSNARLTYPSVSVASSERASRVLRLDTFRGSARTREGPPVLVVGASGTLGRAFVRACASRGLTHVALSRSRLDITEGTAVAAAIETVRPWCVINCAGYVRVDDAEREHHACHVANVDGAADLARACREYGLKLVTFSSDLVFGGEKRAPYVESDAVRPLSVYGRTKAAAEVAVLESASDALVVRTAAFFGDDDDANFVTQALRALAAGRRFAAANDVVVSPTYVADLVDATLDLTIDDERGVWHLASGGAVTWSELARAAATMAGLSSSRLDAVPLRELRPIAPRPLYSALTSERASIMPPLDHALARYARARSWERMQPPQLDTAPYARRNDSGIAVSTSTDARRRPVPGGMTGVRSEA
jgi:dTDP-4-dehydrorhamnose reductase